MNITNIYEAKTHFSQLLERVSRGEEIIIGKSGKPIAKLIPYKEKKYVRKPGLWRGQVEIAKDFDDLPEEIIKAFEGKNE